MYNTVLVVAKLILVMYHLNGILQHFGDTKKFEEFIIWQDY